MAKIRYLMIGTCPICGKEFVRPSLCDVAACTCESAVEVPLSPAIILPLKLYQRAKRTADEEGVSVEKLIFTKGLKRILEENYEKH